MSVELKSIELFTENPKNPNIKGAKKLAVRSVLTKDPPIRLTGRILF